MVEAAEHQKQAFCSRWSSSIWSKDSRATWFWSHFTTSMNSRVCFALGAKDWFLMTKSFAFGNVSWDRDSTKLEVWAGSILLSSVAKRSWIGMLAPSGLDRVRLVVVSRCTAVGSIVTLRSVLSRKRCRVYAPERNRGFEKNAGWVFEAVI